MASIFNLFILSCLFGCVTTLTCDDGTGSCLGTIYTIIGSVVGLLIAIVIIAAVCFGFCAMLGYSCGCLKTTEATPRIRPSSTTDPASQNGIRFHYPPPSYLHSQRHYGTVYPSDNRPSSPPPRYSSLTHGHPPPTYSSLQARISGTSSNVRNNTHHGEVHQHSDNSQCNTLPNALW